MLIIPPPKYRKRRRLVDSPVSPPSPPTVTLVVSVRNNGDGTFTWTFDQPVSTDGEPVPTNTLQIYDDASDSWFDSSDPAVPVGPSTVIVPCSAYPGSAWRIIGDPGGVGIGFDPPPLIPQSGEVL